MSKWRNVLVHFFVDLCVIEVIPQYCFAYRYCARFSRHFHVHSERNFPQAKLNSKINARFLLNDHGNLYFCCIIIVYILSSLLEKKIKNIIGKEKDVGERVQKNRYSVMQFMTEKTTQRPNALRARRLNNAIFPKFYVILFS